MHDVSLIAELKKLLPQCCLPDQVRIGRNLVAALAQVRDKEHATLPVQRWLAEVRASIQLRRRRMQVQRHLRYPAELPITPRRDDIVAALRAHPVVIVAGETGSGKTTQLPKMCLEAGLGARARIGCTQPRRVAAMAISQRLAEELGVKWGHAVGCKIRFADHSRPETSIKVMTDGILLAEIQGDPLLAEYEAIILDEAHERSLNIDFLLGYLKLLLQKRDDLKLIITSATIDTERFALAFGGAPVIEVSGRLYPVEVRYLALDEHAEEEGDVTYIDAAVNTVEALLEESRVGDVLVFMPGERDIRETCDRLRTQHREHLDVVPLFGRLTAAEQQRVFAPGPQRRVVVATNVAETSLTVPRIRYVVDTGLARIRRYHPGTRSNRLPIEPVSQSSANQRKGRCGRLADGVCIRLFSAQDFNARRSYMEPEIQRCDLADVILRMKAFRLGEMESFPFIDPPGSAAVCGAYQLLQELGALDEQRELTALGHDLARLPVDPAIGRMILEAQRENALAEVLIIAAGLSIQDPRERPLEQRDNAAAAHRRFQHPQSDFLTLLNIWNAFHDQWEALKTQNQLRKFCKLHFLSFVRMREWVDIHAQLEEAVEDLRSARSKAQNSNSASRVSRQFPTEEPGVVCRTGVPLVPIHSEPQRQTSLLPCRDPHYAAIHRSILTGLFGHVAQHEKQNLYRLGGNKQAMVFPGSGLFAKTARQKPVRAGSPPEKDRQKALAQPPWLVAGELLETSRLFVRLAAAIDPEWIIELAPHLVKVVHDNPHWAKEAGRVLCTEKVLLRGLVLREQRIGYLKVNPSEATAIFIRSALIEEDLDAPAYRFIERNRRMREKVEMWQTRLPHRVVPDLDETLFEFYTARIQNVASTHDLDRVLKSQRNPDFLCVSEADLLGERAGEFDGAAFPDAVAVAGQPVPVSYAYAPGDERDGVTLRLSVPLAEAVDTARLDWLVPTLREERVAQLLERLPKTLRRALMPLSVTAKEIVQAVSPDSPSFLVAVTEFVRRRFGVAIPVSTWPEKELPPHLRPRFEIVGKDGQALAVGRDLRDLCKRVRAQDTPELAHAWQQVMQKWERYGLRSWDFGDLAERHLVTEAPGFPVYAYPGLHVEHEDVNLRLFRKPEEAVAASRAAVPRLAGRVLHRELGWLQKDLRELNKFGLFYATLGPVEELLQDAFENVRRHLLPEPESPPRTAAAFADYLARARELLPGLVPQFVEWVGAILQKRQVALVSRGLAPPMRAELNVLVPPRLLRQIPFERLAHVPRYVQALIVRAERALLNPGKDTEKAARVRPYGAACQALLAKPSASPEVRERIQQFRWLVEEFKVSCFAQELGTATSVSTKKLDAVLEEIRTAMTKQAAQGIEGKS